MTEPISWADELSVAAFMVTLSGFGLGIWQLVRTRQAAEAAKAAAESTEQKMTSHQLLTLLPQLQNLELELDLAVREGDQRGSLRVLHLWRQAAVQLQTLLTRSPSVGDEMLRLLQQSNALAATAKEVLLSQPPDIVEATQRARSAIAAVCTVVVPGVSSAANSHAKEKVT